LGGMPSITAPRGGPEVVIKEPCGVFDTFILPVKLIQLCYETILPLIEKSADALRTRSVLLWSPRVSNKPAQTQDRPALSF
jgi:hypothetical protein